MSLIQALLDIQYNRCLDEWYKNLSNRETVIDDELIESFSDYMAISLKEFLNRFSMFETKDTITLHNSNWIIWMHTLIRNGQESALVFLARNSPDNEAILHAFRAEGSYNNTNTIFTLVSHVINDFPFLPPFYDQTEWHDRYHECIKAISIEQLKQIIIMNETSLNQLQKTPFQKTKALLYSMQIIYEENRITLYNDKWIVWITSTLHHREEDTFILIASNEYSPEIQQMIKLDECHNNADTIFSILYHCLHDKKELKSDGSIPYHK